MKRIYLLTLVALIAACSLFPTSPNSLNAKFAQAELTHLIGVKRTVRVGETITSSAGLPYRKTISLAETLNFEVEDFGEVIKTSLPKGLYVKTGSDGGELYTYRESVRGAVVGQEANAFDGLVGILFTNDQRTKLLWNREFSSLRAMEAGGFYTFKTVDYAGNLDYVEGTTSLDFTSQVRGAFTSTITFLGIANNQVRFVYREYNNRMAREAFTQEFVMDYVPGEEYAYKSASWVIHKASNKEIEFTLTSSL